MRAACSVILIAVAVVSAQNTERKPVSPCPNIFSYEDRWTEPGKWYGVINLTTDIVLHGLWLNVVLDTKADILGNWLGEVSTKDNVDFKVENSELKINPGPPVAFRFFVQYNALNKAPILKAIRLNGKEICNVNTQAPEIALVIPDAVTKSNKTDDRLNTPWSGSNGGQATTAKTDKVKPTVRIDSTSNVNFDNMNKTTTTSFKVTKTDAKTETTRPTKDSRPDFSMSSNTKPDSNKFDTSSRDDLKSGSTFDPQRQNDGNDFLYKRPQDRSPAVKNSPSSNQFTPNTDNDFVILTSSTTSRSPSYGVNGDGETDEDDYDEDSISGIPTIFIPSNIEKDTKKVQCGRVIFNNSRPEFNENAVSSLEGQFPWQIALYQNQKSGENKYICGGTLVSHRHVITAAHCVTRRGTRKLVKKYTLSVYLGKSNLRTSVDGVQIKLVENMLIHSEYNATTLTRDIAIIQLKEPVTYTDHVVPICLWPESLLDLSSVIGKYGSLVGWGFEESGVTRQELSLVKLPVVDTDTCVKSYSAYFARIISEYSYCATYAEGTSVCNGDSGGGMVFKSGDTWYLRGVASLSIARQNQYRCDPSHYIIFTDVAKFLPWIKMNVYDY